MKALYDNQLRTLTLGVLSLAAVVAFGVLHFLGLRVVHITIAAGDSAGESHIIATALKTVIERQHPRIRVQVLETGGTTDSLRRLEQGQ